QFTRYHTRQLFQGERFLLEIISDTQSSSVIKASLRNCELIPDNGFSCLQDKEAFYQYLT
ncbi:25147_t:CDS:1, partial [Gigaspora rosea]